MDGRKGGRRGEGLSDSRHLKSARRRYRQLGAADTFGQKYRFFPKMFPPEKSLEIVRSRFEGVCEIFLGPKDDFIRKFLRDDTTSGDPRPTDPPAARKDRMRAINQRPGPLMGPK